MRKRGEPFPHGTARAQPSSGVDWPIYFFIAGGFAAFFLTTSLGQNTPQLLLRDPDNYMRLAQVRDFLAGQSWWDVTQYRMDAGQYGNMHWSRLADIPLALAITIFSLFLSQENAEIWAIIAVPPLLLAAAIACMATTAENLFGPTSKKIARFLVLTSPMVIAQFVPGRIDHHALQLTLLAASMAFITGAPALRSGALAAGAAALSLNVGLETAPLLAVLAVTLVARWILVGEPVLALLRGFVGGMVIFAVFFYVASVPYHDWLRATSDQLGRGHLAIIIACGLLFLAVLSRPGATALVRAAQAAVAALPAIPAILWAPELLAGPYDHIDPFIRLLWIENISETASILDVLREDPDQFFTFHLVVLISLFAGFFLALRGRGLPQIVLVLSVLTVGTVLAMWQIRAVAGAASIAIPVAAGGVAYAWENRGSRHGMSKAILAVLLLNGWTGAAIANYLFADDKGSSEITAAAEGSGDTPGNDEAISQCEYAVRDANLNSVPAGLMLSAIDAGAPILIRSHHSVLSIGYHRNVEGTSLAFLALLAPEAEGRALLTERGVDYVFYCARAEFGNFAQSRPDSLGTLIRDGEAPDWLVPVISAPEQGYVLYEIQ